MRVLVLFVVLSLFSCNSYKKIKDKELINLNNQLEGKFFANAVVNDTIKGISIQQLFGLQNTDEIVGVKINENALEIHYKNLLGGNEIEIFRGKFKKNYFKLFTEKKRVIFPPVYCINNVNKFKIGLTNNGDLVVNNHFDRSGMVLLFAAGHSGSKQYLFKRI